MKTYREFLNEMKEPPGFNIPEESHYDKNNNIFKGKTRFYNYDHCYFAKGAKVNVPPYYDKVTRGTVFHIGQDRPHDPLSYKIKLELPSKHPDAIDENGEHTKGSNIKYITMYDHELVKLNPESTWDGI